MRDKHDRQRATPPQVQKVGVQPGAGDLVQRPERFIQQQQVRLHHQGASDGRSHLHAAGKLARIVAIETLQPDQRQRIIDATIRIATRNAGKIQRQAHVAAHARPGHQRRVLKDEGQFAACRSRRLCDRTLDFTPEPHFAVTGREQSCHHLQQCALAAA